MVHIGTSQVVVLTVVFFACLHFSESPLVPQYFFIQTSQLFSSSYPPPIGQTFLYLSYYTPSVESIFNCVITYSFSGCTFPPTDPYQCIRLHALPITPPSPLCPPPRLASSQAPPPNWPAASPAAQPHPARRPARLPPGPPSHPASAPLPCPKPCPVPTPPLKNRLPPITHGSDE